MLRACLTCVPRARKRKLYELLRTIVPTHITKEDTSVAAYGVRNMYGRAAQVNWVPSWMKQGSTMNRNTGHARAGKPGPASASTFAGTARANQTSKTITELNDIVRRGINDASYGSLFRFGKRGLLFIKNFFNMGNHDSGQPKLDSLHQFRAKQDLRRVAGRQLTPRSSIIRKNVSSEISRNMYFREITNRRNSVEVTLDPMQTKLEVFGRDGGLDSAPQVAIGGSARKQ